MTGHIRQRSGSYEIRYQVSGKTRTETVRGTKRDAQRRLRELLVLVDHNRHPTDNGRLTVGAWFERWLGIVESEVAAQTHFNYAATVRKYMLPMLGNRVLSRLSPAEVQQFYSDLGSKGLAAGTVRRIASTLSTALRRAAELKLLVQSPTEGVRRRVARVAPVGPQVLDRDQSMRLLAAAAAAENDVYTATLIGLATGMRRNEIIALRWRQIDLDGGLIAVEHSVVHLERKISLKAPKSGHARTVTIPAEVVAELRRAKRDQAEALLRLGVRQAADTPVLARADGSVRSPGGLSWQFERVAEKAGMPVANFHVLRHSHASELLRIGIPVHTVAQRLGHRDGGALLLRTYAHTTKDAERAAADAIGGLFGNL